MLMQLTNERLAEYIRGQMEVKNSDEGYLYHGEIEAINIEHGLLNVRFAWIATTKSFPKTSGFWVMDNCLDYSASLEVFTPHEIEDDRICLSSCAVGELVVLHPPGGSKLDPAEVEGLTS